MTAGMQQPAVAIGRPGRGVPDKRSAILDAAAGLFADRGYARTTTRAIASAAGVAEGTIFLYFASKRHILLAFVELVAVKSLAEYLEASEGMPVADVIRGFLLNRYGVWETHGHVMKVVFGEALFDQEMAEAYRAAVIGPVTETMERYLARESAAGRTRAIEPRLAARALIGLVFSPTVVYQAMLKGGDRAFTSEQYADGFTALFLNGIAWPGPAQADGELPAAPD